MNKKYSLEAVVEGRYKRFRKKFNSRNSAINFIFNYYDRHQLFDLKINEEYFVNENKHDIAYIYDYDNRFRISRAQ